jgi:tetratricopeptide (TPR) repeat protein
MRSFVLHALLAVSIALGALGSHERLASAQSSAPNEHARRRAKDLYEAGVKHYNVLEYDQAIDSFKQAYLLFPTAGSLYNIAQSYRKKGTAFCTSAANFYRSYLRERADAPDRPDVEARIADAERCAASNPQSREVDATTAPRTSAPASATPERAPAPAPDSQEHLAHRSTLPLWIAGAGAVVLVAGGVLYGVALAKHGSLEDECSARNCPPDRWQPWQTTTYVSYGLVAAGTAIGVGALTWYFVQPRDSTKGTTVGIAVTPAGVIAHGRFF